MEFAGILKYVSYAMMGMSVWGFLKALYDENWKGAIISGLLLSLLVIFSPLLPELQLFSQLRLWPY